VRNHPRADLLDVLKCPAVERLLDAGANIEALDDRGLTPIRQAIYEEVDCRQTDARAATSRDS
jgi:hypothetical protein